MSKYAVMLINIFIYSLICSCNSMQIMNESEINDFSDINVCHVDDADFSFTNDFRGITYSIPKEVDLEKSGGFVIPLTIVNHSDDAVLVSVATLDMMFYVISNDNWGTCGGDITSIPAQEKEEIIQGKSSANNVLRRRIRIFHANEFGEMDLDGANISIRILLTGRVKNSEESFFYSINEEFIFTDGRWVSSKKMGKGAEKSEVRKVEGQN